MKYTAAASTTARWLDILLPVGTDWTYQDYALNKKTLLFLVVELPYRGRLVALCPPDPGWVEVSTPQLPVEALSRQRVLLDLERIVFDVVKGWRHNPRPVLLDSLQDRFCPAGQARGNRNVLQLFISRS